MTKNSMRFGSFLIIASVMLTTDALAQRPQAPRDSAVVLQGILQTGEFFGPPNYGEDPTTDRLGRAFYIQLPAPISYQAAFGRAPATEGLASGFFVQLVVADDALSTQAQGLVGRRVQVTGTLFEAVTGHHRTDLLLTVTRLVPIERWEW